MTRPATGWGHWASYAVVISVTLAATFGVLAIGDGIDPPSTSPFASADGVRAVVGADGPRLEGSELAGRLFLAVAVVILVARVVGSLFTRIHQPRVIGEIVAGIVLGPSLLGLVIPQATEYLFRPEVTGVLRMMAQFGLVFFMFLVGLRLDLAEVSRSGRTALFVSHASIAGPFVLGLVTALVIYPRVGAGDFTAFALFLGAAMAITAFPVLARILTDTGLDRTRLGTLAITCAAVDDVTAWCILSVVVAVARGGNAGDVLATIVLAGAFMVVMTTVVRPLARRALDARTAHGRLDGTTLAVLLVGLFVSAWAAEAVGIHAVFGAFLMGTIVPREHGLATAVGGRLEDVTSMFLLPLFFAVVGLSTQVRLLDSAGLWAMTALVLAAAIVGKWGASATAARACGLPWRQASAVGLLMNARGLTEIVILTIGLELEVISPAVFTAMVLMALVTTLMTTPLLARTLPGQVAPLSTRDGAPAVEPAA